MSDVQAAAETLTESELSAIEARAKAMLLALDPVVPTLVFDLTDSWQYPHLLSKDVAEFGWSGALSSPYVQRLLDRLTEALRSQREQLAAIEQILDAAGVERERTLSVEEMNRLHDQTGGMEPYLTALKREATPLTLAERVQRVVGRK